MDGMYKSIGDEIRKRLEDEALNATEWEDISGKVNMVLDLADDDKLSAENFSHFFSTYDLLLKYAPGPHTSFVPTIVKLGDLSEKIVIDEAHRSSVNYLASEKLIYILEEPSEPYKSIRVDESSRVKNILLDVYKDNSKLITLGSREFEEIVAELLAKQGFKVELTKRTRDGGYDIIALLNYNHHNPMKFLVECKRQAKNKVGVEVIRSFKNVVDSTNVNRGIFVTTSYFTKGSWDEQKKYPYLLDYRDKDKVIEWVNSYVDDIK